MKIISKFQDYYDSALAYGVEPFYYIRKKEEVGNLEKIQNLKLNFYTKHNLDFSDDKRVSNFCNDLIDIHYVGFCGKFYPVFSHTIKYEEPFMKDKTIFGKTKIDVIESIKKHTISKAEEKKIYKGYRKLYRPNKMSFNEKMTKDINKLNSFNLFQEYKVPILLVSYDGKSTFTQKYIYLEKNPCLKDLGFFVYKDPYTTYQEISGYISGVLGIQEVDTVDIGDEYKLLQKGFNNYSFKTRPKS